MSYSLLLDFGATRIKSALWDDSTGKLLDIKSRPCTKTNSTHLPYFEIPLAGLTRDFVSVCEDYAARYDYEKIFICSQMHGFVLTDEKHHPLTDYISWQDERALLTHGQEPSSWELFSHTFASDFQSITGMRLRMGFPAVKVLDFLRQHPGMTIRVLSLPEALLLAAKPYHKVHLTMAAGSGLVDFETRQGSQKLLEFISHTTQGAHVAFNEIVTEIVPAGELSVKHKTRLVYTGVGDHQCAILGAGNTLETLSINIGTGSQVSAICKKAPTGTKTERRPFFNNLQLQTITHIPAGRVLAELVNFYHTLTGKDGWEQFQNISTDDIERATLQFNLAFFPDAWGFQNGAGSISGLTANGLTEKNFWASLFRSFVQQYISAIHLFSINRKRIVLSGGKLAKHPLLINQLEKQLKIPCVAIPLAEETLTGLAQLAQTAN
ncbi:MAG: hypothetical protein IKP96_05905 [Elusimicrobiaceae bacterium]|nr:hypothetical protein [Elusimicrobiaceae bacterium]